MTLFQQLGVDLKYLSITKPKHGLRTWWLLGFTIAFDIPMYDLSSAEASKVHESGTHAGTSYMRFIEGCCRSCDNLKNLGCSEHSPLIKEYPSHIETFVSP